MKKISVIRNIAILLCFLCAVGFLIGWKNSDKASENTTWFAQADKAVAASLEAAMQYDPYEYATGSQNGKEIVCFYSGSESSRYSSGNDEINMDITQKACVYAYEQYCRTLTENLPEDFTEKINSFKITNVYKDTAYVYDIITGAKNIYSSAGLVSSIEIDTNIVSGDSSQGASVNQRWTMKPTS